MTWLRSALLTVPTLVGGCFTADLDPTLAGVFACDVDDDCPSAMACINEVCESGDPPTVAINFPEDEQRFEITDFDVGAQREIEMTLAGTLDVTEPGGEHVFGEGHIEITVDGRVAGQVTSGALSGVLPFPVAIENTLGAHRIAARAIRNDGTPYDHAGGTATRLFWVKDGATPLVGIKQPWPGTEFDLSKAKTGVEAAVLNFTLAPAVMNGDNASGVGHVHIYYNDNITDCLANPTCDKAYLNTIVEAGMISTVQLPDSPEGTFNLNVVLRNIDHSLYLFPEDGGGAPVIDTIPLVRKQDD